MKNFKLCSWSGRPDIIKISVLSKLIHRINAFSVENPVGFIKYGRWYSDSKIVVEIQSAKHSQSNIEDR